MYSHAQKLNIHAMEVHGYREWLKLWMCLPQCMGECRNGRKLDFCVCWRLDLVTLFKIGDMEFGFLLKR